MFRTLIFSGCIFLLVACSATSNKQATDTKHVGMPKISKEEMAAMMQKVSTPSESHALLKQYLGSWKTVTRAWNEPGSEPEVTNGTSKFTTALGGRFIEQSFQGKMMGKPFSGKGLVGFDNAQGKFVSTWVDSISTGVMTSDGELHKEANQIVWNGEFYCPIAKGFIKTREVMTLVSNNKFTFEMYTNGPDGSEMKMLEVSYSR